MEHTHGRHLSVVGPADPAGSGLLLGQDVRTGADVELPDEVRLRGVTVIGKTGTGKSRLLERLVLDDLRRDIPRWSLIRMVGLPAACWRWRLRTSASG